VNYNGDIYNNNGENTIMLPRVHLSMLQHQVLKVRSVISLT